MDSRALITTANPATFPPAKPRVNPPPPSSSLQTQTPPQNPLKPIKSKSPKFSIKSETPKFSKSKTPKFSERDAFPCSLPLHSKLPHAIYKDIQRFAGLNKLGEALTILDYLEHRGVPVNPTTFSALISACSRTKNLTFARQIHTHIRINGLDRNEFLLTRLVEMYASCGSPDDAKRVFSGLPPVTVHPWNALLRGNVVSGERWGHGPLSIFTAMREAGVQLNEYTFSSLIKSFAGSPAFTQGMKAHALLVKNGFVGSPAMIKTSLVDMYSKCGKMRMAVKVFDEIVERDVVSWGAIIAGFAHNHLKREALEYLRWMCDEGIEPNSVIFTIILPVIGELLERTLGREVHAYVMKRFTNYDRMVFVQSGLIDMYCKCGDMVSGRRVFYGSNGRNVVSWTALMSGYASNGRFEQALRSIIWMQQEGVKPDVVLIATALPVCSQLRALKQGRELHGYALKSRFLPNVSISTSLMTMYSSSGRLDCSCNVFNSMERKNVVAWTALIDSYLKNGRPYDALDAFRLMRIENDKRPDAVALARVSSAAGDLGALKLAKEIHGQAYKMKLEQIPFVSAEVVGMYGKCGDIGHARKVFDAVPSKGSLTWTAIIEAYGVNGRSGEALKLFDRMLSIGYVPNHFTFDTVLSICDRAAFVDEALRVFDLMVREYELKASEEHYSCIVGLLTSVGRIDEAQGYSDLRSILVQL